MVTGCRCIGVCYSATEEPETFHFMDIEKWPLVQAFANESYQSQGFFTMLYQVKDISEMVQPLFCVIDWTYLENIITKHLPSFEHQWSVMIQSTAHAIQSGRGEITESGIREPLETYYKHACLNTQYQQQYSDSRHQPFVFIGSNASKDHILNPQPSLKKSSPLSYDITASSPVLVVCQEVSAKVPLRCCRTYFIDEFHLTDNSESDDAKNKFRLMQILYLTLVEAVLQAINVYKESASVQQAKNTALNVIKESSVLFKSDVLGNHLRISKNIEFVLEDINTKSSQKNPFVDKDGQCRHRSTIKWIQMSIWNIPDCGGQNSSSACSLTFGETFLVSALLFSDDNSLTTKSTEVQVLTAQIPRYHCWTNVPIQDNISHIGDCLKLTDMLGDAVCDSNTIELVDADTVWDVVRTGHLFVQQHGLVVHLTGQNPVIVPNSGITSLDIYYEDSSSSAVVVLLNLTATSCLHKLLVPSLNDRRTLILLFQPKTKANKILFAKLLPHWKNGTIPLVYLKQLPSHIAKLCNSRLTSSLEVAANQKMVWTLDQASDHLHGLDIFLHHLLVSNSHIQQPIVTDLGRILLTGSSPLPTTTTTGTEDNKHTVVVTILAGIRGSYKESFCKVFTGLAKDYNSWIIFQQPIRNAEEFDAKKLQQQLSCSLQNQSQQIRRSASGGRKSMRIIVVVPGYTEIIDVVRAVHSHPDRHIAAQMDIGAVTVCVNPDNSFLENRFMFPTLWNQCLEGWINNILFIASKKSEKNLHLIKKIEQLVKKKNHQVNILTVFDGQLNMSSDIDLILSENSFNTDELIRSRHLITPNWMDPQTSKTQYSAAVPVVDVKLVFDKELDKTLFIQRLTGLKEQLAGYPFHGNVYHVRGQVQFLKEKSMCELQYITLSNQLIIDKVTLQPQPPGQKLQSQQKSFLVFSGCYLNKDELKIWLKTCLKKIGSQKPFLDRHQLSNKLVRLIQKRHSVDQLPPGWFFNGQSYVSLTGERSPNHPNLDQFLDHYTATKNSEITNYNKKIDKQNQENILQFFEED
ncbi:uncharacterized protein C20orf194-like isoform X2 [Octopus sinensis]|nr:uncharacterized protein C20orf194-like isoform X2 [Octopus sinensis]